VLGYLGGPFDQIDMSVVDLNNIGLGSTYWGVVILERLARQWLCFLTALAGLSLGCDYGREGDVGSIEPGRVAGSSQLIVVLASTAGADEVLLLRPGNGKVLERVVSFKLEGVGVAVGLDGDHGVVAAEASDDRWTLHRMTDEGETTSVSPPRLAGRGVEAVTGLTEPGGGWLIATGTRVLVFDQTASEIAWRELGAVVLEVASCRSGYLVVDELGWVRVLDVELNPIAERQLDRQRMFHASISPSCEWVVLDAATPGADDRAFVVLDGQLRDALLHPKDDGQRGPWVDDTGKCYVLDYSDDLNRVPCR
jgi:hypothetical protein